MSSAGGGGVEGGGGGVDGGGGGEALAAISSVSRLSLASNSGDLAEGWQVTVEGRDMAPSVAPTAHPRGSTVTMRDLFFNTPARRRFLRIGQDKAGRRNRQPHEVLARAGLP